MSTALKINEVSTEFASYAPTLYQLFTSGVCTVKEKAQQVL